MSDLLMRCDNVDLVEFELDDPTTTCGHVAQVTDLAEHNQPDHKGLNSCKQSKNKHELNCNQDIANKDESFIGGILQVRSTGGLDRHSCLWRRVANS